MAIFNKFQGFVTAMAAGTHVNCLNADTDVLKVYLSNVAPDAAADSVKADLAEITAGNGYTAGGADVQNAASTATGTITVVGTDVTWVASGGAIAQFRYVVLYNDTAASDNLIGWWDNGSAVDLADGDSFKADFGANLFTVQ